MVARRPLRRVLRAVATHVGVFVSILALVIGILRAGQSYFFCPMMEAVLDAPCCGESHHAFAESGVQAPDCCQAKRIGSVPSSSAVSSVHEVAPSPCVGLLPAIPDMEASKTPAAALRYTQPARAGPRSASERRADLMVWHS